MRVAIVGCAVMALLPLIGKVPVIGWFATMWPVVWGFWVYLASQVARETRTLSVDNPRIPAMAWSAAIGGLTGFVGAVSGVALNSLLAAAAAALGPQAAFAAAGHAFSAGVGLISLVTRPFWGILVCGVAGLAMGGGPAASRRET